MHLAFGEQGADDPSGVIHRDVTQQVHLAGLGVDLDDGQVGAKRERRTGRGEVDFGEERVPVLRRRRRELGPTARHRRRTHHVEVSLRFVEHDVLTVRFQEAGREVLGLFDDVHRCLIDRGAPDLQRTRAHGAGAARHDVGVAVDNFNVLDRNSELLGDEHRPRRHVPLSVRRGSRAHDHLAVRSNFNGAKLTVGQSVRNLHVARQTDAELAHVARSAPPGLLGPQLVVARHFESQVERAVIVADVVERLDRCRVGKVVLANQIAAAQLRGVHFDFACEHVHDPLDGGRGLGTPGPAVGRGRRRIGDDRDARAFGLRYLVRSRGHDPGHERKHRTEPRVGTTVLQHFNAIRLYDALTGPANSHVLNLGAAVAQSEHALRARLGPAHRTAELQRAPPHDDVFGVDRGFGSESASDVGRNHVHLIGFEPEEGRERVANAVRSLGRRVELQTSVLTHMSSRGANFERTRRDTLIDQFQFDYDVAIVEERLVATEVEGKGGVRPGVREEQILVGSRSDGINDDIERVVLDHHLFQSVFRDLTRLGDDGGDGFAHVAHRTGGEHRRGHRFIRHAHDGREFGQPKVVVGVDGDNARHRLYVCRVNRHDSGVRHARTHERHVDRAGQRKIVHVGPSHGKELGVLSPQHAITKNTHGPDLPLDVPPAYTYPFSDLPEHCGRDYQRRGTAVRLTRRGGRASTVPTHRGWFFAPVTTRARWHSAREWITRNDTAAGRIVIHCLFNSPTDANDKM